MNNTALEQRDIVNFYELPEEWQKQAKSNLDEFAEENSYLMPLDNQSPDTHILYDLNECMRYSGGDFNAFIGISNNSAMLLQIDDCCESALIKFV